MSTDEKCCHQSEMIKNKIEQEKGQQQLLKSIETFEAEKLHHAKTEEKNPLPTKEEIEAEKKQTSA
ncbi:hypothetical protein BLA29_014636 [Euroglyphus maynei]|uniref:Uncharacterized protein n=1 Tax=Euroglyphus maynei TaxID=6958 RepID=A0A1Y3BFK1_EURMA|nr:hypothetical protein BLA29_014636 [Euroglyphus maynei]